MTHHAPLHTSWQIDEIAQLRDTYYAASQRKFVPFAEPMIFKKGSMQYLWDAEGRKYTDLLGMNVCISVGHSHPTVVAAATAQAQELTHCTTMFYHPTPCASGARSWRQRCRRAMNGSCISPTRGPRRWIWP